MKKLYSLLIKFAINFKYEQNFYFYIKYLNK